MPKINPSLVKGEKVKKTLTPEHLDKLQKARQLYQKTRQEERLKKKLETEKVETDIIETTPIKEEDKEIDETEIKPEIKPILDVEQETIFNEKKNDDESLDDKILKHIKALKKARKKVIIQESDTSSDEDIVLRKIRKKKVQYVERTPSPLAQPMPPPVLQQTKQYNLFSQLTPFNNRGFNNFTFDTTLQGHYH